MTIATVAGCSTEPTPTALELTGDLRTHDPALVAGQGDDPWFVYSTGDVKVGLGAPQIRKSTDQGHTWEMVGTAWTAAGDPAWVRDLIPGVQNFWAPELYFHDGLWYLYYTASTFGSNLSAIGLATSPTLDPADPDFAWTDQGEVIHSAPGQTNYNCIDAAIVEDEDGQPWLFFGSFWGGIFQVPLDWSTGKPVAGVEPVKVASRLGVANNPIEAAYVIHHGDYFYLFFSRDSCCQGVDSTYNVAVGRSSSIDGPYVDAEGTDLVMGGGTPVLWADGAMIGPGGQSVSGDYLGFHYYDGDDGGNFRLAIHQMTWDDDGWPQAMIEA
ncbi:MAG: arabinan endo-1,5-alpha-L-arabinosidase [Propionibacteriaceae bacterium]|jgi:arabinan endo-1,5-alpha-L-arabinosidase|nr:arabinan endo-1,5-alpha-L-arabinosidase [Propionibacteriaceae bacterium]